MGEIIVASSEEDTASTGDRGFRSIWLCESLNFCKKYPAASNNQMLNIRCDQGPSEVT